jgi:hypothetical protein
MGLTANTGPYNAAAEHYGVDDPVMTKIPRSKYQFALELTLNPTDASVENPGPFIFHRVEGVSLPDYNYNVVRVNEYNRIRYVSTRIEYTPMTVNFYDTKDNQWQNIMLSYANHYSTQGHSLDPNATLQNNPSAPGQTHPFGINPVSAQERFFFPRIRVLSTDTANNGRIISLYNCMITQINHDRLAYSDSSPVMWSVQFQPEQVNLSSSNSGNGSNPEQGANSVNQPYDVSRSQNAGIYVDINGNPIRDNTGSTIPFNASIQFNSEGITGSVYATAGPFSVGASIPILRRDGNGQPQVITQGQDALRRISQNVTSTASSVISDIQDFFS